MAKTTAKYVAQITPELDKKGMSKFYSGMKSMAQKSKKIWDKTFTLKNMIAGGAISAGIMGALTSSSRRIGEVGTAIQSAVGEADIASVLGAFSGASGGRIQAILDTMKAFGVNKEDISTIYAGFSDLASRGVIRGEANWSGFETYLSNMMTEKDVGKKQEMLLALGARKATKLMELSTTDLDAFKAKFKEIYGGKSVEEIDKTTEKLASAEEKISTEKIKEEIKTRTEIAKKTPEELVNTALYEQRKATELLIENISKLTSLFEGAQLEAKGRILVEKGLLEAISTLNKLLKFSTNIFGGK